MNVFFNAAGRTQLAASLCSVILLCGATASFGQTKDASPHVNVPLPFGQKSLWPYSNYPTARIWPFKKTVGLYAHITADSVGPESAVLFYQPKDAKPGGELLLYDITVSQKDRDAYAGVCFWLKGDGGDGNVSLGCNWTQNSPHNPIIGSFPLSDRKWKKYFIPWDDFKRPAKGQFYFINVQLQPAGKRECRAVLSRLSLYKTEQIEKVKPAAAKDPGGAIAADKFVLPNVEKAAALMPKTMALLKAKKPVTIVVMGDSITAGAQLWYMDPGKPRGERSYPANYAAVLEETLARHYGYKNHRYVLKFLQGSGYAIVTGQKPQANGALPFDGLQVIAVGAGGKNSRYGQQTLDSQVLPFKPDLVIWTYGANDAPPGRVSSYTDPTQNVIRQLRKRGVEVAVAAPVPWLDPPSYKNSLKLQAAAIQLGKELKVPVIDQVAAFTARGDRYRGDLMSDVIHPNEFGHQTLAATLAAALGVSGINRGQSPIWINRDK